MMADSDKAWRRWAVIDPYYGVLSDDKYRSKSLDSHRDEFFASGELFVAERLDAARRHFGYTPVGRALDYGCGVGRLTLPLAGYFEEAVGIDIAPAMLAEARRNAAVRGVHNITFLEPRDGLSDQAGTFGFVNTYIVLQHIPPRRGMPILDSLLECVQSKGIAAIHVSIRRTDTRAQRGGYWLKENVPGATRLANILKGRRASEPMMQMNEYPLDAVLAMLKAKGFGSVIVDSEYHGRSFTAKLLAQRN